MSSKPGLAPARAKWTRIDAYVDGLRRHRLARRAKIASQRSEPDSPKVMLSTIPIAALIAVLGMLVVAIAIAAWPPSQPTPRPAAAAAKELGTAQRGWFQEAKKEFR